MPAVEDRINEKFNVIGRLQEENIRLKSQAGVAANLLVMLKALAYEFEGSMKTPQRSKLREAIADAERAFI